MMAHFHCFILELADFKYQASKLIKIYIHAYSYNCRGERYSFIIQLLFKDAFFFVYVECKKTALAYRYVRVCRVPN
jgi:hypothetical protein